MSYVCRAALPGQGATRPPGWVGARPAE